MLQLRAHIGVGKPDPSLSRCIRVLIDLPEMAAYTQGRILSFLDLADCIDVGGGEFRFLIADTGLLGEADVWYWVTFDDREFRLDVPRSHLRAAPAFRTSTADVRRILSEVSDVIASERMSGVEHLYLGSFGDDVIDFRWPRAKP